MPKLSLKATIRTKLLVLTGILLSALVGSNLYMRTQLLAGSNALGEQTQINDTARVATTALQEFGELKFWLSNLEVTWLNESEENAEQARAALEEQLQTLRAIAPNEVAEVLANIEKVVAHSIEAVDAYVDENRALGNSLVAKAAVSIQTVDEILVAIADDYKQQAAAAEAAATEGAKNALNVSLLVLICATVLSVLLTWAIVRSVVRPMKKMVIAMTEVSSGNIDVDVPKATKDEIGELARALGVFKGNAVDKQRLEAEQHEAEQRAETEKRAAMERLASSFEATVMGVVDSVSSASTEMRTSLGQRRRGFYSFLLRYINYYGPNPQYMDPDTLEPLINNEAGIQALENYKRTIDLGPPGMLAWEWDEAHAAFMQGRVATLVHWPDEGLMTDLYTANTGAQMGFAKMPGAVVDGTKMERTMTGGGWIIGMSADSRNQEAAYTVLRHILSPEASLHLVLMPGTDIFRTSQFEHPVIKQVAPAKYLEVYQESITDNFPELRIPGGFEYYDALDVAVQKALAGQLGVKEALDEAAAQWERITDRIGRDGQREAYKAAMGL